MRPSYNPVIRGLRQPLYTRLRGHLRGRSIVGSMGRHSSLGAVLPRARQDSSAYGALHTLIAY